MDHLKPKNKIWWENWIKDQPLPSMVILEGKFKKKMINQKVFRDNFRFLAKRTFSRIIYECRILRNFRES
jgi:hypothetical protein